jgi:hypothetical protein
MVTTKIMVATGAARKYSIMMELKIACKSTPKQLNNFTYMPVTKNALNLLFIVLCLFYGL